LKDRCGGGKSFEVFSYLVCDLELSERRIAS